MGEEVLGGWEGERGRGICAGELGDGLSSPWVVSGGGLWVGLNWVEISWRIQWVYFVTVYWVIL